MFKIGISGCGYWGVNLAKACLRAEGVKVEAICDPDAGARNAVARLFNGDVKTHSQFDYLLSDSIDGVIIATPPRFHVDQSVQALKRGKAVFVEKPPAMTIQDMETLLEAARGKTLVADYIFLYNPLVTWLHDRVREVGFWPLHIQMNWLNFGIVRRGVDVWWSTGPHPISILAYLFDEPTIEQRCQGANPAHAGAIGFVNGASWSALLSWAYPLKVRRIEIVARDEILVLDDVAKNVWVSNEDGTFSPPIVYEPQPLDLAIANFVNCAKTGTESVSGPTMIERVTRLMV